jgi:transposase
MPTYSLDLRERALAAYDAGQETLAAITKRFSVSRTWIHDLLKRRREEGTIAPRPHGGGHPTAFSGKTIALLDKFLSAHPDATLEEIRDHFSGRVECSIVTVHNTLHRLGYRVKKNTPCG